ncbi:MAG: dephospho-CoA kinase, partial [Christensenellaceae bacterium]|nr:dephospho-CoA kinase [Christensenellaceae bacterium]
IWLITADRETRVSRIIARNGLTREEAEGRIDNQMPEEEKRRRAHRVIENNGTMRMLYEEIEKLKEILKA